jgi:hypothetical protein
MTIGGYWLLFYCGYYWLLVNIILVGINSYYIGDYSTLNYHKLLMVIGGYW